MSVVQLRSKAWFGDDPLALDFPPSWKIVDVGPQDSPVLTTVTVVYRCAPFLIPSEAVVLQDLTVSRRDSVRLSASA